MSYSHDRITDSYDPLASSDVDVDINIVGIECDVSSELSVQKAYEQIMTTFGRVDSVVASAGGDHQQLSFRAWP